MCDWLRGNAGTHERTNWGRAGKKAAVAMAKQLNVPGKIECMTAVPFPTRYSVKTMNLDRPCLGDLIVGHIVWESCDTCYKCLLKRPAAVLRYSMTGPGAHKA
jgi:hypothetical protein